MRIHTPSFCKMHSHVANKNRQTKIIDSIKFLKYIVFPFEKKKKSRLENLRHDKSLKQKPIRNQTLLVPAQLIEHPLL